MWFTILSVEKNRNKIKIMLKFAIKTNFNQVLKKTKRLYLKKLKMFGNNLKAELPKKT